jgi:PST family polysaccharide transporter
MNKVVARGAVVNYGAFMCSKLVTFASTVVLARLLVPREFGVVGYALLVLGLLYVIKNFGMGTALIYGQDLDDDRASSLLMIAVVAAAIAVLVAWISAPYVAHFFHDSRIVWVTRVLSFSLLINAFGELHGAQMRKRMRFGRQAIPTVASATTKGVCSIGLAVAGLGYWSLVWGQLAGDVVMTAGCWILYPWMPKFRSGLRSVQHLIRFGMHVAVVEVVLLLLMNVDNVVVGRAEGTAPLGMYDLAYTIPQMLTIGLAVAVSQAVYPALASVQHDHDSIRTNYRAVLRYTALIILPIGAGLSVVAPAFVHTFYNHHWWPMIPAARTLALYATLFAIGWGVGDVHQALGRPDRQWRLDFVHLAVLVPACIIGVGIGGIAGVAVAQLVVVVPAFAGRLWLVHRVLDLRLSKLLEVLWVPACGAVAIYAGCLAVEAIAGSGMSPSLLLATQVLTGLAIYALVVLSLDGDLRARLPRPGSAVRAAAAEPSPSRTPT